MMKSQNKAFVVVIIFVVMLGGYAAYTNKASLPTPAVLPDAELLQKYSCIVGNIQARFSDTEVALTLSDGRSFILRQVPSASGTRYEKDSIVFITKGGNAFLEEGGETTYYNCLLNAAPMIGTEEGYALFMDQGKTVSFVYPKEFFVTGGEIGYTSSWRVNTQTLGLTLAKLEIPKDVQPQTNFSGATFTVGTSSDTAAVRDCLVPTNGERAKGTELINGVTYAKITLTDAGAGNYYDTTSYHLLRNDQCYVVEYTIHSTNLRNYSPEQGITEFDTAAIVKTLNAMVQSVRFL